MNYASEIFGLALMYDYIATETLGTKNMSGTTYFADLNFLVYPSFCCLIYIRFELALYSTY